MFAGSYPNNFQTHHGGSTSECFFQDMPTEYKLSKVLSNLPYPQQMTVDILWPFAISKARDLFLSKISLYVDTFIAVISS